MEVKGGAGKTSRPGKGERKKDLLSCTEEVKGVSSLGRKRKTEFGEKGNDGPL